MAASQFSVTQHAIETLLTWVKTREIAIPEIQRPFVWSRTDVRDLLDSLYRGYPVGYLITWQNPTVKLKDGSSSVGKKILIDGQQRVTALMAALLGREVLTQHYKTTRITIAFHPGTQRFEVSNSAIRRDPGWIADVAEVFAPDGRLYKLVQGYLARNEGADPEEVWEVIGRLEKITNALVGVIELASGLDLETITEIFHRVNKKGVPLSQADFAMSKIAVNEAYGGHLLRKAIDYFCHSAKAPEFLRQIQHRDEEFARSEFMSQMRWLRDRPEDIVVPSYVDVLRVAFTSEAGRGRLQDLVALLSGRNFATRGYEEEITAGSFKQLKTGVTSFINETHFNRFTMILRSAGFVTSSLTRGRSNAINFAYIVYLRGRAIGIPASDLEQLVRRWFALSVLRRRYGASVDTSFDTDIRAIGEQGLVDFTEAVVQSEMTTGFWHVMMPQNMGVSVSTSPYFRAYQAAQVRSGDKGFLSKDITVADLLTLRGDRHHIYPRHHLIECMGSTQRDYNQIANLAIVQSEINIAIGKKPPQQYFAELREQCRGGPRLYGGITDEDEMRQNLIAHCVPVEMLDGEIPDYQDFLQQRRLLMARKIKAWFETL